MTRQTHSQRKRIWRFEQQTEAGAVELFRSMGVDEIVVNTNKHYVKLHCPILQDTGKEILKENNV